MKTVKPGQAVTREKLVGLLESCGWNKAEVARRIGENIASLIPDGATLQMGIGEIPDAVLDFLEDKKHLGVHTEMFSDGLVDLFEAGVVTNEKKTLHRGKIVASFVIGTRRAFDFVDNNPFMEFHPSEYVNDPYVVSRNDKMVAINSAISVDLTGQVCADSIGTRIYSGFGGQLDFIRGAARSDEGGPWRASGGLAAHALGRKLNGRQRVLDFMRQPPDQGVCRLPL